MQISKSTFSDSPLQRNFLGHFGNIDQTQTMKIEETSESQKESFIIPIQNGLNDVNFANREPRSNFLIPTLGGYTPNSPTKDEDSKIVSFRGHLKNPSKIRSPSTKIMKPNTDPTNVQYESDISTKLNSNT